MANNSLTENGLTVGDGTITKFISAFGSVIHGEGNLTLTTPSKVTKLPSSVNIGSTATFLYIDSGRFGYVPTVILPSAGVYAYSNLITHDEDSRNYDAYDDVLSAVKNKTVTIKSLTKVTGGTVIAGDSGGTSSSSNVYSGISGGIIRIG